MAFFTQYDVFAAFWHPRSGFVSGNMTSPVSRSHTRLWREEWVAKWCTPNTTSSRMSTTWHLCALIHLSPSPHTSLPSAFLHLMTCWLARTRLWRDGADSARAAHCLQFSRRWGQAHVRNQKSCDWFWRENITWNVMKSFYITFMLEIYFDWDISVSLKINVVRWIVLRVFPARVWEMVDRLLLACQLQGLYRQYYGWKSVQPIWSCTCKVIWQLRSLHKIYWRQIVR